MIEMNRVFLIGLSVATALFAQDESRLQIQTVPDSAVVFLDANPKPEPERTPYDNSQMIPGQHQVRLEGPSAIYRSAYLPVLIKREETATLEHVFAYRNKSFLFESLPVAPGILRAELGFQALSDYSAPVKVDTIKADSAKKNTASGSTGGEIRLPLTLRLGLPPGFEVFATLPFGRRNFGNDSVGSFGVSDLDLGAKFLIRPIQSALILDYKIGNASPAQLGDNYRSLGLGMASTISFFGVLAQSNILYRHGFQNGSVDPSHNFVGDLEFGYPISIFKPMLGISGNFHIPYHQDTLSFFDAQGTVNVQPGVILELGETSYLQFGIPITLLHKNNPGAWGINLSFSTDIQAFTPKIQKEDDAKTPEKMQARAVPGQAMGSFVLMAQTVVTNKEYRVFVQKTGALPPEDPGFASMPDYFNDPKYEEYPVVGVSYIDAKRYASWLGKRLPRQKEWQSAASQMSLNAKNVACGLDTPMPAKSFQQGNQLFNLVGNVSEWLESESPNPNAPKLHAGGSYVLPVEKCLDASKLIDINLGKGARTIGFRVVDEVK